MRRDANRPFADHANRLNHMPWMLPGYQPIVPQRTLWQRIKDVLRIE